MKSVHPTVTLLPKGPKILHMQLITRTAVASADGTFDVEKDNSITQATRV